MISAEWEKAIKKAIKDGKALFFQAADVWLYGKRIFFTEKRRQRLMGMGLS